MFKRLYWSGSRAKFYNVTWLGNETGFSLAGKYITPDYHANVNNAFSAAHWLADYLTSLGGADVVAAHSLGNMVVSRAVQDWNAPISQYFLIDAAVAAEAYSRDEPKNANMVHPAWPGPMPEDSWASEWYKLFPASDNRSRLTWRDRLIGVGPQAYNFYSSTEDVLAEQVGVPDPALNNLPTGTIFNNLCAWALQEKLKGRCNVPSLAPRCGYGGWGFNENRAYQASLTVSPFFDASAPAGPDLYDPAKGSDFASPQQHANQLLAEMMPARTLAAGRGALKAFDDRNFDMSVSLRNGWPAERFAEDRNRWKHSDFRQVAYLYVYKLYEQFKLIGKLDQ